MSPADVWTSRRLIRKVPVVHELAMMLGRKTERSNRGPPSVAVVAEPAVIHGVTDVGGVMAAVDPARQRALFGTARC